MRQTILIMKKTFFSQILTIFSSWRAYLYVLITVPLALFLAILFQSKYGLFLFDVLFFYPLFAFHLMRKEIINAVRLATLWGIWKSILFLALMVSKPYLLDTIVMGAKEYHFDAMQWILRGEGVIAHPEIFVWLHISLLLQVVVSSIISFGFIPMVIGSYQLNIMNYHVGKLIVLSKFKVAPLFLGWPPWSLVRGWAYLFMIVGTVPIFLKLIKNKKSDEIRISPKFIIGGIILVIVDLLLKTLVAPYWRVALNEAIG
jgi:hypothetical protein